MQQLYSLEEKQPYRKSAPHKNLSRNTAGTDGRTIESLAVMPEDKFVKLIQKQFRRYEPKAVKRVEIPKPNGKMRPLGIPCIIDRTDDIVCEKEDG